jgi:DnaJ domain
MNYYEELGVSRSASIAEIRQAYKSLVRVLHPDQQQEEDLRRVSELQLRRLNHMLQVLSDPLQRRQYDLGLGRLLPVLMQADAPQKLSLSEFRGVRLKLRLNAGVLVWLLIATIAVATGIFWIRSPEPVYSEPVRVSEEKPVEQARTPVAKASDRHQRAPVQAESDPLEQTARYHAPPVAPKPSRNDSFTTSAGKPSTEPLRAASVTPPPSLAPPVQQPKEPSIPVPAANPKTADRSISGEWLYVPQHDDTKKGMYPPEYIEMRITRRVGLLQGRYHAKYRVSDRPISSEVNFQFEGKQGDAVSVLPWFGSNGSKGELRLKRISDDSIEVNWVTTSFGNTNTLASGTAVLYRSDTP